MPYVITSLCIDCKDTACADVCPVECIYEVNDGASGYANQLYINPDECIDCTNCEPACPWKAVFEEDQVPAVFAADIEKNRAMTDSIDDFHVAKVVKDHSPTADQIAANFAKWNYKP
ncbi:MAG: ferredoxin family protein [Deltaproteobacteria bacterium]|nr:ferredoxin family protein [Deltaproteobacteria bacterium]